MSKRNNHTLLTDILESVEKIFRYTEGMTYKDFCSDEKTIDAVARNLEIIGEAANRIDDTVHAAHPEIEWRRIIGLRNRIVHEYFGIDLDMLWMIIEENLAGFQTQISDLADKLEE